MGSGAPPGGLRVLALEPFYGGSHRAFLDGWVAGSRHRWTVLGLGARKWKWRMRHGALTLARQVDQLQCQGDQWDALFCSDMLALAEWRGLVSGPAARLPAIFYFHENQLTYPVREERERDLHFAVTNFVSALAADEVWFNSAFHRNELLAALPRLLRRLPDRSLLQEVESLEEHSRVEWPGVRDPLGEARHTTDSADRSGPLRIVWAARWEHDKDPETFFRALKRLLPRMRFEVSVLGESYQEQPVIFEQAREWLGERVRRWGHLESRADYAAELVACDVFVSTARHEFFGLATVEAGLAGAFPLLPRRLSYPELLDIGEGDPSEHVYEGRAGGLARGLERLATRKAKGALQRGSTRLRFSRFLWKQRLEALDEGIERVARRTRNSLSRSTT